MNELIESNFLKKYKIKGKYALTQQEYDAIEIIEKIILIRGDSNGF